jgi:hypothetical protein
MPLATRIIPGPTATETPEGFDILEKAIEKHPDMGLGGWFRCTGRQSMRWTKRYLQELADMKVKEAEARTGLKVRWFELGPKEGGSLIGSRPHYDRAIKHAIEDNCVLFTTDSSRHFRPEGYYRGNHNAVYTAADWRRLNNRTKGAILATLIDPLLSESELHSQRIRQTGKAGRPPIPLEEVIKVFSAVEEIVWKTDRDDRWRPRWKPTIRRLARRFKWSIGAIQGFPYLDITPGVMWWDYFSKHESTDHDTPGQMIWLPQEALALECSKTIRRRGPNVLPNGMPAVVEFMNIRDRSTGGSKCS